MSQICIPNINRAERRKRLTGGIVMFILSLIILGVLLALGAARWWRLGLFPLLWGAASGFFQWREKT